MAEVVPDPKAYDTCDVCDEDAEDTPGLKLSRCSTCKNRFYCVRHASRPAPAARTQ